MGVGLLTLQSWTMVADARWHRWFSDGGWDNEACRDPWVFPAPDGPRPDKTTTGGLRVADDRAGLESRSAQGAWA